MTICKFWQQGNCKFGDKCKFEHPGSSDGQRRNDRGGGNDYNRSQNQNSFGSLSNRISHPQQQYQNPRNPQHNRSGGGGGGGGGGPPPQNHGNRGRHMPVREEHIEQDLRMERPMWIMSCYGPFFTGERLLWGGYPLEQSPEEVRVQHYLAVAAGSPQQSIQMEGELATKANQQVENALNNLRDAVKYLDDGQYDHPNRREICNENTSVGKGKQPDGVFSRENNRFQPPRQPQQQQQPPQQPSSFGQPALGQPQPASSSFAPHNSPFGQAAPTAGFGAQPGFGTPPASQFSGNTQSQMNAFGAQPQPVPQQQDAVMSAPSPTAGFGQMNQPQQPQMNGFGQPPPQPMGNFGQPMQPIAGAFGGPSPDNGGFGQGSGNTNGFGAPTGMPSQPSTFGGQPQPPANGFGSGQSSNVSGFHQPSQGAGPTLSNIGAHNNDDVASYSSRDGSGRLLTWKGQPVTYDNGEAFYRRGDGGLEKIWFPDGAPAPVTANEMPGAQYSEDTAKAYQFLKENGRFQDGVMPSVAPKTEWCTWDI